MLATDVAAGCGGGSSNVPSLDSPSPTALPTAASTTIPLSSTTLAVPLAALRGVASTITLPVNDAPAGASLQVDESNSLP